MKEALSALKEYQDILTRISQLEKQLSHVPKEIQKLENEWKNLTGQTKALQIEIENQTQTRHQAELNLAIQQEKHEKFEKDLSEVTNDKEYNAVLREIDNAKKEISTYSKKIKECDATTIDVESKIEDIEGLAAESEKNYKQQLEEFRGSQTAGSKELEVLIVERKKALERVPKGMFSKFSRVAERRNGVGLAYCQDSICKACNVRVRHHIVEQLKMRDKIFQCESCRRILYFLESETEG